MRVSQLIRPLLVAAVLTTTAFSGCGGPTVKVEDKSGTAPAPTGKEQIKKRLTEIAGSGIGGSAVSGIRDALNELKKTDAALAEGLLTDLDELEKLEDSDQIKAKAGQMAGRL